MSNPLIAQLDSRSTGILNTGDTQEFYMDIAGQSIGASSYYTTNQTFTVIPVDQALMQVRVKFTGLESVWRYIAGDTTVTFPAYPNRQFRVQFQRTGNNLKVYVVIYNTSVGTLSSPAFTLDVATTFALPPWNT